MSAKGRASAIFNFSAASGSSLAAVFAFHAGFDGLGVLAASVAALNLAAGAHTVWKLRHNDGYTSHGNARTPD
jgi:hypothetical protein